MVYPSYMKKKIYFEYNEKKCVSSLYSWKIKGKKIYSSWKMGVHSKCA